MTTICEGCPESKIAGRDVVESVPDPNSSICRDCLSDRIKAHIEEYTEGDPPSDCSKCQYGGRA